MAIAFAVLATLGARDALHVTTDHWGAVPSSDGGTVPGGTVPGWKPGHCGVDGARVQTLYLHVFGSPSRLDEHRDAFLRAMGSADGVFLRGTGKGLRWTTDGGCVPTIDPVPVPRANSFAEIVAHLEGVGFADRDRKYLLLMDMDWVCGVANIYPDSRPGQENRNNHGPQYALVGSNCWASGFVLAHELGHVMGAVQVDSPNSDGWWHCLDEYDLMCYGPETRVVCPDPARRTEMDCNRDDYANPDPPPGSYLDTNWNLVNSRFLGDHAHVSWLPLVSGGEGDTLTGPGYPR